MGSFDMSLQVEDFVNSDSEDLMALMQETQCCNKPLHSSA